jgi:hypothetical protein
VLHKKVVMCKCVVSIKSHILGYLAIPEYRYCSIRFTAQDPPKFWQAVIKRYELISIFNNY